jgi:hypothetical protein
VRFPERFPLQGYNVLRVVSFRSFLPETDLSTSTPAADTGWHFLLLSILFLFSRFR